MDLTGAMREFVIHWGEMGSRWGVNRTVAQIHALLYLSPEPLTADEIAETLAVARSNVSTSLRELQHWDLVQVTHILGDRRDRFVTVHDVWEIFMIITQQRIEREIAPTVAMLRKCVDSAQKDSATNPNVTARLRDMSSFLENLKDWYDEMKELPRGTLMTLLKIRAGVRKRIQSKGR